MSRMVSKLCSGKGIARLTGILLVITLALVLFVGGVPAYHYFHDRSQAYGCGSALATANEQLRIYCITDGSADAETAKAVVTRAMDGWDDLCPAGGDCYIVHTEEQEDPYMVICALHPDDEQLALKLNVRAMARQIETENDRAAQDGQEFPAEVTLTVNSQKYSAVWDEERQLEPIQNKLFRKAKYSVVYDLNEDGRVCWLAFRSGIRTTCIQDVQDFIIDDRMED